MEIHISQGECEGLFVDRSGLADPSRDMRQGFDVGVGSFRIHFEDERGAVTLAKAVLGRMGELEDDEETARVTADDFIEYTSGGEVARHAPTCKCQDCTAVRWGRFPGKVVRDDG